MKSKFLKILIFSVAVVFFIAPYFSFAQEPKCDPKKENGEIGYCLLEPIFAGQDTNPVSMGEYLSKLYKAFFITAGVLATLMLIIGGFQYMTSEAVGNKSAAVSRMQSAVGGLFLALFSYFILANINEDLVNVNFELTPIKGIEKPQVSDGATPTTPTPAPGGAWPSDADIRNQFKLSGIGVVGTVTNEPCAFVGDAGCTSLYGLPSTVLPKLVDLNKKCEGGCGIVVTGGTEYWAHSSHGVGKAIVDIDDNSKLDAYITKNGIRNDSIKCGLASAPKYNILGSGTYVDEGNHWHVCY